MLNYQLTSTFASGEDGTNQNTLDQTLAGNLFFNPVASFANQQHHLVSPMQFNTENYNSASTYPPISQSHLSEYVETAPELYLSRPLVLAENADIPAGYPVMLGLNLGERINISSSEKDFDRHLWRITKISDYSPMNLIRCQADGCMANLYGAKNYYRRHKVCDFHSKAAAVFTGGQTQRFCQQCSRFHLVSEFDQEKRSCRKRLADHNRRRRKVLSQQNEQEQFQNMESPSSESIVVSSPFNALKCINPKHHATTGSVSSRIRM